jgi:hypothetical protein
MLAEGFKFLTDLARRSSEPQLLPSDPWTERRLIDGQVQAFAHQPEPRDHEPGCLDDLIRLAVRFEGAVGSSTEGESLSPVVWYDRGAVVVVLDDAGDRLEAATLTLEHSDVFQLLCRLRASPREAWLEQKPFVRLLRVELAGTLDPFMLLDPVRTMRWESTATTSGTVGRQQESLGREIASKVRTEQDLPEDVVLQVPVFKTPGETARWPMRCSVDADPALCKIQLLPLPDEVERVIDLALMSIRDRLVQGLGEIPCYRGKP